MEYGLYPRNNKMYSGAERKFGITIENQDYIIKFRKKTQFGKRNNHISEYIGCRIFRSLGMDVQEVYLGTYKHEEVVVIKDFISENQNFVTFNDVGESSIEEDRDKYTYTYQGIMDILYNNNKLKDPINTVEMFWKLYVVDALIGNFDRHGGNWGFIKENNIYTLAPVFDNGSCLYPNMVDEDEMRKVINSEYETNKRIYKFPTSQIRLDNKKSYYFDVISSLKYKECNKALIHVVQHFDIKKIETIITNTKFIGEIQKEFYLHMIKERYNKIHKYSYDRMMKK